jgi:predicted enzyme related to lactoylglutathione lyase
VGLQSLWLFFEGLSWRRLAWRLPVTPQLAALAQGENVDMSSPFVWFHNNGNNPIETKEFLESLLGRQASTGPGGMTMLATNDGPFAALGSTQDRYGDRDEWVPFVAVADVDLATQRALELGGVVVREKRRGPAGEFAVVRDPGGAALALWKKS